MGAIDDFLRNRKEKWLKNNLKTNISDAAAKEIKDKAEEKFAKENWIADAAKRARQLSLASHVCKFSHPDAKSSSVISTCEFRKDGYLRSGNVACELDAYGNAAAVDVFEFLLTAMEDGKTIIDHLERNSEEIKRELTIAKEYDRVRTEFLEIKKANQEIKSDERLKQVYFPVGDNYHLLSIMTASGVLRELQGRINGMVEKARSARKKDHEDYGRDYDAMYDLTVTAYGGTKPQNISVLNLRNRGNAYLLSSTPPVIVSRDITRPRHDFFRNTLRGRQYSEDFRYLHALFKCDRNNLAIRNRIKDTLQVIIDKVMGVVYQLRETEAGWSKADSHHQLPLAQKIWLDDTYVEERNQNGEWVDEVSASFAQWLIRTYEKVLKEDHFPLGDGEMAFLQNQVELALLDDEGIRG